MTHLKSVFDVNSDKGILIYSEAGICLFVRIIVSLLSQVQVQELFAFSRDKIARARSSFNLGALESVCISKQKS